MYNVAGTETLITSVIAPIKINGTVVAVAGVDIALDNRNFWFWGCLDQGVN